MQNKIIELISTDYTKRRTNNSAFSLRAYARKLGIQVSALSEILNGKRTISTKMASKILTNLGYGPLEIEQITEQKAVDVNESNLSLEYFRIISDWYYFAILSLAEIDNFRADEEWIAQRLNISKKEAKLALARLLKLGMLEVDKNGKVRATGIQYKTPTDTLNMSLKNHTIQTLDLASKSLLNDPLKI